MLDDRTHGPRSGGHDSDLDLLETNSADVANVFINPGSGLFNTVPEIRVVTDTPNRPRLVGPVDLNGDGLWDPVVGGYDGAANKAKSSSANSPF